MFKCARAARKSLKSNKTKNRRAKIIKIEKGKKFNLDAVINTFIPPRFFIGK